MNRHFIISVLMLVTLAFAPVFAACGKRVAKPLETVGPGPKPKCAQGEYAFRCVTRMWPPHTEPSDTPASIAMCTELQRWFCAPGKDYAIASAQALLRHLVAQHPSVGDWWVNFDCFDDSGKGPKPSAFNERDLAVLEELQAHAGARSDCASCLATEATSGCATLYGACNQDAACQSCLSCVASGGGVAVCGSMCGGTAASLAQCLGAACASSCSSTSDPEAPTLDGWGPVDACGGAELPYEVAPECPPGPGESFDACVSDCDCASLVCDDVNGACAG